MYGGNWSNQNMGGGYGRPGQNCPSQTFPTNFEQPVVSPTREFVRTNIFNTVVPHVHPSHTHTVNKHMVTHQHYFPHTESVSNECFETHTMCGMPHDGCCSSRRRRRF